MNSHIYEGRVRHTRKSPARHQFEYRVFLMYLDLDELDDVFEKHWLWSASRPALARFRRRDHLGPADKRLKEAVSDRVEQEIGRRPNGPIRLLTNLSYFGYCFNPVSFYYCFDATGQSVETIVAEVNNTPWGERRTYVLDRRDASTRHDSLQFRPKKKMHVSPFLPMDAGYDWVFSEPGETLNVYMAVNDSTRRVFNASLRLERRKISSSSLARVLITYPFATATTVAGIYWQALKLWLKRCPVYRHPATNEHCEAGSQ